MQDIFTKSLKEHQDVFNCLGNEISSISKCAELIWKAFADGKKVLLCGNGGSAADAQHIAAEFVGRYETERRALPSVALTTDTSALTAIGNDYGYERIFARQVEALAKKGDVLIGISTSGNSPNVLAALQKSREIGCINIGMTGAKGGKIVELCDACLCVPSERTARIQEAHITVAHIWCEYIDKQVKLTDKI
jgi:D-sedoheptulose 7-phosphate isomerase